MGADKTDIATQPSARFPVKGGSRRHYDLAGEVADYPDRPEGPDSTLVLCSQQRCGSTLLAEALYFAGGLGCALEYFHGAFRRTFEARWQTQGLASYIAVLHRRRTDPSGVLAVKLFWSDVEALVGELAPGRYDWLRKARPAQVSDDVYREIHDLLLPILPRPTFVRLRREDTIAQAVSTSVAIQRGRWRKIDAADPAHDREVEFRFPRIALALARIQRHDTHWARFYEANGVAPYTLTYESLAGDYEGEVKRLLTALGRSDADTVQPRMHKQADASSLRLAEQFRARVRALTRGAGAAS